jgi:hypothetical protein
LQPVTGFNYYLIKQIDNDGTYKYSIIVTVLKKEGMEHTIIAPNPVKNILYVVEPKQTFIESAEIYSTSGTLLLRKTINADVQLYSLPVSNLTSAAYIIKINYKNESRSYRFIKE